MKNRISLRRNDIYTVWSIIIFGSLMAMCLFLFYSKAINEPSKGIVSDGIIQANLLTQLNINRFTSILADPDKSLTIKDVVKLDSEFKPITDRVVSLNFAESKYWFKFSVDFSDVEKGSTFHLTQQYPFTYGMWLYSPTVEGYTVQHIDLLQPWTERPYKSNLLTFDIVAGPDPTATYYLSVQNSEGLPVQILLNLSNRQQFFDLIQSTVIFDAFFYCTSLAFLFYTCLMLFQLKDRSYMLYGGYLLLIILGFAVYDNYITRYFIFSPSYYMFLIILPNLQFNLGVRHAQVILNTKVNLPKTHQLFSFIIKLHTMSIPLLGLLGPRYAFGISFVFFILYIGFSIVYLFSCYETLKMVHLRLFVIGWTLPVAFGGVFVFSYFGFFLDPVFSFKFLKIGILWQAMFASLDIAEQIKAARAQVGVSEKEKVIAEKTALLKSEFLANMSHELRDPMNRVIGYSSQALSEASPIEKDKFLLKVAENSSHLLNTINNILDYSKMEYGNFKLKNEVFSIADVKQRLIKYFPVSNSNIIFEINNNTDSSYFVGDSACLFRILVNLIGNAFKFTAKGRISVEFNELPINSPLQQDQNVYVIIVVRDTGIGIAKEKFTRLFLPFEQVDISSTRQYEGSGLGLSISKSLVELMQGSIDVNSTFGQGSTFTVSIPLAIADKKIPDTDHSDDISLIGDIQHLEVIQGSPRILLVDDSDLNQEFMINYLEGKVAHLDSANNGIEAILKVLRYDFDLVLMDVQMAMMDGYEATQRIRKMGYVNLPIIALSATMRESDEHRGLDAGMNDFISKPVVFSELHKKINQWITISTSSGSAVDGIKREQSHIDQLNTDVIAAETQEDLVSNAHRSLMRVIGQLTMEIKSRNDEQVEQLARLAKSITDGIGLTQMSALFDFLSRYLSVLGSSDRDCIVELLQRRLENKKPGSKTLISELEENTVEL